MDRRSEVRLADDVGLLVGSYGTRLKTLES
jgi:hypothetical protein